MDVNKKTPTSKIVKIIFIIIFAISTVGYFAFIPFLNDKLTEVEGNIMIALMFLDAGLWVISFFGFLITLLLDSVKKVNPELYAKLVVYDKNKSFIYNVWNSVVIMLITSVVLLLIFTIISTVLESQIVWLIILAISIVVSIVIAICIGWKKLGKILFIAVLIAALISFTVPAIINIVDGSSTSNSGACGVCGGSGLVPKDGVGFATCPYCKGAGIPPL